LKHRTRVRGAYQDGGRVRKSLLRAGALALMRGYSQSKHTARTIGFTTFASGNFQPAENLFPPAGTYPSRTRVTCADRGTRAPRRGSGLGRSVQTSGKAGRPALATALLRTSSSRWHANTPMHGGRLAAAVHIHDPREKGEENNGRYAAAPVGMVTWVHHAGVTVIPHIFSACGEPFLPVQGYTPVEWSSLSLTEV
jgi:hypothetical protein